MVPYINEHGKECFHSVLLMDEFDPDKFHEVSGQCGDDVQFALHTNLGSFTVLDRMTGFGWRDVETGYRDPSGDFWLASGMFDVRQSGANTFIEAIEWVKTRANNMVGE